MTPEGAPPRRFPSWLHIALSLALAKLALHLVVNAYFTPLYGYGVFRDELYFLDCGRHLAWGYVDQPPLIALASRLVLAMGGSLFAIRLLPALAGAGLVLVTGLIARELGGDRIGVAIACASVIFTPTYLLEHTILTMNAFEPLLWMVMAYLVLRLIKGADERLWLALGAVAGVSLLNKYTAIVFITALVGGLLLTPERRLLRSRWFASAVLIAAVIVAPNMLWQWHNGWPTREFVANVRASGKNISVDPLVFFFQQYIAIGVFTVVYWMSGLWWLLWGPSGKRYRALGLAFVLAFAICLFGKAKYYYLVPAYGMLFAAGGTARELFLRKPRGVWWRFEPWVLFGASAILILPFVLPAFPLPQEEALVKRWEPEVMLFERHPMPRIYPQFAEMMGWPEMAQAVSYAYHSLPPEQQQRTAVFASDYARAGALNHFRDRYPLPPVVSGHQNYWLWGPQGFRGDTLLLVGPAPKVLTDQCSDIRQVGVVNHPYSMPDDNGPILLCSGLKLPLAELWPQLKSYI